MGNRLPSLLVLLSLLLSGCQSTTSQYSAATSSEKSFQNAPKSVTVSNKLAAKTIYNQSFPSVTYTNPTGIYQLDQAKSRSNYFYYKAPSTFSVSFDSGHEINDKTTEGHLVIPKKEALKNDIDPSKIYFSLNHTDDTEQSASNKSAHRVMTYNPTYNTYIGLGGANKISNGNKLSLVPNH